MNEEIKRYIDSLYIEYGHKDDWYIFIANFLNWIEAGEEIETALSLTKEEFDY